MQLLGYFLHATNDKHWLTVRWGLPLVYIGKLIFSTRCGHSWTLRWLDIKRATLLFLLTACLNHAYAANAITDKLNEAQAALSSGDYKSAYTKFKHLAKKHNNELAQFTLALFYDYGWGRPVDHHAACQWYERAAQAEVPVALHRHAECLLRGDNFKPDPIAPATWFERAAAQGHRISLCALAELYMHGQGVVKNPAKGMEYCRQAARENILPAQLQTAKYLLEGDESIRDIDAASKWFHQAAENGSSEAAHYLGLISRNRLDDLGISLFWFERAAGQGYVPSYYATSKGYFDSLMLDRTQTPPAPTLAKAYMWLSASVARTDRPEEKSSAAKMLITVRKMIPESWVPDLDQKIAKHLVAHDQSRE